MKEEKKNIQKLKTRETKMNKLDIKKKSRLLTCLMTVGSLLLCVSNVALATGTSDPMAVVQNLSDFIFGLIRAIGMILLGFGIMQVGFSLKSHDPSQRANGFMVIAGGIVITFTKEILNMITGG